MARPDFKVGVTLKGKDQASGPIGAAMGRINRQAKAAFAPIGRMMGGLTSIKTLAAGIATGAAVRGLSRAFSSYTDAADELAKSSRALGLGVEAMQEWRHAAEIAGVGGEMFGKALGQINRRIGEMKGGKGDLLAFLTTIGPGFRDQLMGARDADEAMQIAIKGLEAIEDPSRRAALASKMFGEELGVRMVRLADMGTEAIRRQREQARSYARGPEQWASEKGMLAKRFYQAEGRKASVDEFEAVREAYWFRRLSRRFSGDPPPGMAGKLVNMELVRYPWRAAAPGVVERIRLDFQRWARGGES